MQRRQTKLPSEWLIADSGFGEGLWPAVRKLPRGSGILALFHDLPARDRHGLLRKLRRAAKARGLHLVDEGAGQARRVHNRNELRQALLARTPLILLSPIHATSSHPDWAPLPRMRAAALARLGGRRLIALGGMDARRFRRIERLGFQAWAGIGAFRT